MEQQLESNTSEKMTCNLVMMG